MTTVVAVGRRYLPRGWADFGRQLAIWFGFVFAYQLARGLADRNPAKAFANGIRVLDLEERITHRFYELTFQQFVDQRHWLALAVSWTYWNSEFTVLGLALLYVYLRRHEAFTRFRNTILLANVLGLFGYVFMPMAPPRLLDVGFADAHSDGLVQLAANPYAAMPSLHAADSLIVGIVLALIAKRWWAKLFWSVWPAWVWFVVMASGNHFWLDCIAGLGVAILAMSMVYGPAARRIYTAHRA
ncbi:MAG TPA: phosphatase PAP2 family protein [Gaiellaceae bacterium]